MKLVVGTEVEVKPMRIFDADGLFFSMAIGEILIIKPGMAWLGRRYGVKFVLPGIGLRAAYFSRWELTRLHSAPAGTDGWVTNVG